MRWLGRFPHVNVITSWRHGAYAHSEATPQTRDRVLRARPPPGASGQGGADRPLALRPGDAAVRQTLAEDAEDLAAFEARAREPNLAFEDVLKDLKRRGQLSVLINRRRSRNSNPCRSRPAGNLPARSEGWLSNPGRTARRSCRARNGYRVRQGEYRAVYAIDDGERTVVVVKVATAGTPIASEAASRLAHQLRAIMPVSAQSSLP